MELHRGVRSIATGAGCALLLAALIASAAAAADEPQTDNHWDKGRQWLSLRAGYAKSAEENSGDGFLGFGVGFDRMLNKKYSLGVAVYREVLGRFGSAEEIEVPAVLELQRHFFWKTPLRPYIGIGGGVYQRKFYRTTADDGSTHGGAFISLGANTPLDAHHLLGLDVRANAVQGLSDHVFRIENDQTVEANEYRRRNPVFGKQDSRFLHWSVKLHWTTVY